MSRTWNEFSIILKMYPVAEIHAGVYMLTRSRGVVQALAHGVRSAKGSLRGVCQVLNCGMAYYYEDKVKSSIKLKEFVVQNEFAGIKASLAKTLHALVWLELHTHQAGDAGAEQEVLLKALELLDGMDDRLVWQAGVQYLARFLLANGVWPDLDTDAARGTPLQPDDLVHLSAVDGGFVRCHDQNSGLGYGVRRYLAHTLGLPLPEAVHIGLTQQQVRILYAALLNYLQAQFQYRLQSADGLAMLP